MLSHRTIKDKRRRGCSSHVAATSQSLKAAVHEVRLSANQTGELTEDRARSGLPLVMVLAH